jgi:hypothetical protein
MLPNSDDIERLVGRARELTSELRSLGQREVTQASLKEQLASVAREWLRVSQNLRERAICDSAKLSEFDQLMEDVLNSTTIRARASSLQRKLSPFVEGAITSVVVPLIQFEGSPRQVAARQVLGAINSPLTPDENDYVQEAARCVTIQGYRAAIIMLWAAAMARFHAAIVGRGFDAFNKAVDATISKKGHPFSRVRDGSKLTSLPELQRSKDADLIVVGMELFGYDLQVFQELDRTLGVRNGAAHPGMGQPTSLDVLQFASKVDQYVLQYVG